MDHEWFASAPTELPGLCVVDAGDRPVDIREGAVVAVCFCPESLARRKGRESASRESGRPPEAA